MLGPEGILLPPRLLPPTPSPCCPDRVWEAGSFPLATVGSPISRGRLGRSPKVGDVEPFGRWGGGRKAQWGLGPAVKEAAGATPSPSLAPPVRPTWGAQPPGNTAVGPAWLRGFRSSLNPESRLLEAWQAAVSLWGATDSTGPSTFRVASVLCDVCEPPALCDSLTTSEWLETTHTYDPPSLGQESQRSSAGSYEAAIEALARLPRLQTQLGKEPPPTLTRLLGAGWVAEGPVSCWLEAGGCPAGLSTGRLTGVSFLTARVSPLQDAVTTSCHITTSACSTCRRRGSQCPPSREGSHKGLGSRAPGGRVCLPHPRRGPRASRASSPGLL